MEVMHHNTRSAGKLAESIKQPSKRNSSMAAKREVDAEYTICTIGLQLPPWVLNLEVLDMQQTAQLGTRDVLEGGGEGVWLGQPSSLGPPLPPVVPTEGGPKFFKLKSSWRRRRRSKILAVNLKHWKGRRGGREKGGPGGGGLTPSSYCVRPF